MNRHKETLGERIFYYCIIVSLSIGTIIMIAPLINVLAVSFSSSLAVDTGQVKFFPVNFTFTSWDRILSKGDLLNSFLLTLFITVIGTVSSLFISSLMAYPLAKKDFMISKYVMIMVVITMIFRYPLIPYFLTIYNFGMYDSILALILPHTVVAYNMIILRTFFKQIPEEVEESAKIEGYGYFQILFRIILPMSKPALATIGLFYAVLYWNQFLHPLLFIESKELYPLQLMIRQYITGEQNQNTLVVADENFNFATLKAATTIFAILPIMLVYPLLQKYFVKGANLGAVKG
jgi:putative aldouronate transport system permease protein